LEQEIPLHARRMGLAGAARQFAPLGRRFLPVFRWLPRLALRRGFQAQAAVDATHAARAEEPERALHATAHVQQQHFDGFPLQALEVGGAGLGFGLSAFGFR